MPSLIPEFLRALSTDAGSCGRRRAWFSVVQGQVSVWNFMLPQLPHLSRRAPSKLCSGGLISSNFKSTTNDISFDAIISAMRTTVALDDDLVRIAQEFHRGGRKKRR